MNLELKAKQREIWEKQWGEYLTLHRKPKDPETSSTISISMGYNTTGTSTYTKEPQITEYEPNISEIATVPRTTITQLTERTSQKRYLTTYQHSMET